MTSLAAADTGEARGGFPGVCPRFGQGHERSMNLRRPRLLSTSPTGEGVAWSLLAQRSCWHLLRARSCFVLGPVVRIFFEYVLQGQ